MNEEYFGPHLMLDLAGCDKSILTDIDKMYNLLEELPGKIGMTRISTPQVLKYVDKWAKTPGVTGVVILAESHISLHTFPDSGHVFLDVFSCRSFDVEATKKRIIDYFNAKEQDVHVVKRGLRFNKEVTVPMID